MGPRFRRRPVKYQLVRTEWAVVTYLAFPFFVAFLPAFLFPALPPSSLSLSNRVFLDFAASAVDVARFRLLGAMDGGGELLRRRLLFVRVSMMVVGTEERFNDKQ
jgi:hypothetical protein